MSESVELIHCPHCFCLWAENWPYDKCTKDQCWCELQPNVWWHDADLVIHESNEAEALSGSEDPTEILPLIKEIK
jgi:hypothetical protein